MLNKLTYFVQCEPVTPVKRNNLLFHSLRTTLNSLTTTHPIVSKYTVTVKIKNTWVWNTSHTNTAHLLANTKANVMETPAVNQPEGSAQAWQPQHAQSRLWECTLTFPSTTAVSIPHPPPPESCSRPFRWQMHSSASITNRKSSRATVSDFTHQSKLRLWLKVQVSSCRPLVRDFPQKSLQNNNPVRQVHLLVFLQYPVHITESSWRQTCPFTAL